MKVYQAIESDPMKKFRFRKTFGLSSYVDPMEPVLVLGVYSRRQIEAIKAHKGPVVVVWMGSDAIGALVKSAMIPGVIHTTWVPPIQDALQRQGIDCILLRVPRKEIDPPALIKGEAVYAYLQRSKPEYHGKEIVESLRLRRSIIIGDHSIPRQRWENRMNNRIYQKAFIGLFLSSFAGGGMSVVEMGVRGIPVVTNVMRLPHCIPWHNRMGIEQAILRAEEGIGKKDDELAEEVKKELAVIDGCFDIDELRL